MWKTPTGIQIPSRCSGSGNRTSIPRVRGHGGADHTSLDEIKRLISGMAGATHDGDTLPCARPGRGVREAGLNAPSVLSRSLNSPPAPARLSAPDRHRSLPTASTHQPYQPTNTFPRPSGVEPRPASRIPPIRARIVTFSAQSLVSGRERPSQDSAWNWKSPPWSSMLPSLRPQCALCFGRCAPAAWERRRPLCR